MTEAHKGFCAEFKNRPFLIQYIKHVLIRNDPNYLEVVVYDGARGVIDHELFHKFTTLLFSIWANPWKHDIFCN